ncbi:MAG: sterol desaturase family protein [Gammaproteobacteria bacterium]|nr:sterol desaturase family protein [Gammaproteobacteria bacterium]
MLQTLKHWLWDAELFEPNEKFWRPLANAYVVLFAIVFTSTFWLFMNHAGRLGPGLGEDDSIGAWQDLIERLNGYGEAMGSPIPLIAVAALFFGGIIWRAYIVMRGYFKFKAHEGEAFPLRLLGTIGLVNLFNIVAIQIVLVTLGVISYFLFEDFSIGWTTIEQLAAVAHSWVSKVPTIIELHPILTIFVVYMLQGFLHYWLHRVGHTFRAGWLLFHRQHHLSPQLIYPTTSEVFYAIPLFLFAVIPYNLIFAAASKLFSPDPLYVEFILINMVFLISEIYGHNTALYHEGRKNPIIKALGWLFLNGPYHYLHHSAEEADAGKNGAVNMTNIGGGLFGLWDRMFGPYSGLREERPPVGLTGNPELYMHPLRLACGGMAQIGYELWKNKSWKDRFWILFGNSNWNPPVTHDFAVKHQA